jgi:hypothetical protein
MYTNCVYTPTTAATFNITGQNTHHAKLLNDIAPKLYSKYTCPSVPLMNPQTVAAATSTDTLNFAREQNVSSDLDTLAGEARQLASAAGWIIKYSREASCMRFSAIEYPDGEEAVISKTVTVMGNMSWTVTIHGHTLDPNSHDLLSSVPSKIDGINSLNELIWLVTESNMCIGNPDRFHKVFEEKGRVLKGKNYTFYEERGYKVFDKEMNIIYTRTARMDSCQFIIARGKQKCHSCQKGRMLLRAAASRLVQKKINSDSQVKKTYHASRVPLSHLSTNEIRQRLQSSQKEKWRLRAKVRTLEENIKKLVEKDGIRVDKELHEDLKKVVVEKSSHANKEVFEEGTYQHLFWEQQKKQALRMDARAMRWHPLMIKWCLALRQNSPSAYSFIRESGMISLPSDRTLFDFSQWTNVQSGFNVAVIEKLGEELDLENCEQYKKNVP